MLSQEFLEWLQTPIIPPRVGETVEDYHYPYGGGCACGFPWPCEVMRIIQSHAR